MYPYSKYLAISRPFTSVFCYSSSACILCNMSLLKQKVFLGLAFLWSSILLALLIIRILMRRGEWGESREHRVHLNVQSDKKTLWIYKWKERWEGWTRGMFFCLFVLFFSQCGCYFYFFSMWPLSPSHCSLGDVITGVWTIGTQHSALNIGYLRRSVLCLEKSSPRTQESLGFDFCQAGKERTIRSQTVSDSSIQRHKMVTKSVWAQSRWGRRLLYRF